MLWIGQEKLAFMFCPTSTYDVGTICHREMTLTDGVSAPVSGSSPDTDASAHIIRYLESTPASARQTLARSDAHHQHDNSRLIAKMWPVAEVPRCADCPVQLLTCE